MSLPNSKINTSNVARFLLVLLLLDALVSLAALAADANDYRLLRQIEQGVEPAYDVLEANEQYFEWIVQAQLLVFAFTSIAFLRWTYLVASKAQQFVEDPLHYSPAMCVGSYFIPILNFVRPFQAMKQIWQVSLTPPGQDWKDRMVPSVVGCWWFLWIIGGIIAQFVNFSSVGATTIEQFTTLRQLTVCLNVEQLLLTITLIVLVRQLEQAQQVREQMEETVEQSRCPACAEVVDSGSRVCPMCGGTLPRDAGPAFA